MKDTPKNNKGWLKEIALAYKDAAESIPFGKLIGDDIKESDLFAIAPNVCLKFRKIKSTEANIKKAKDAAFSSYVATKNNLGDLMDNPLISFSLCYLASHLGLEIVNEKTLNSAMEYVELNLKSLESEIALI